MKQHLAQKVLVQKSGARTLGARQCRGSGIDRNNVRQSSGKRTCRVSGVIGHDEAKASQPLRAIEFPRIRGIAEAFDINQNWFRDLLREIGQPTPAAR